MHPANRKEQTRAAWLETLARHRSAFDTPDSEHYWSTRADTASRDEIIAVQNDKLAVLTPFLYEHSGFYRRRFDRLGLAPTDIRTLDDLPQWPVVTGREMAEDAAQHPPYGTYQTIGPEEWADRGWMQFSTSGSTGTPRVFRYTHVDREYWEWANARALWSMGIRRGETLFPISGFGPHVFVWGVVAAATRMKLSVIPGGGMDAQARVRVIDRFRPTVLVCTPSYALYLARTMEHMGLDPAASAIRTVLVGGEPALGIEATRTRLEALWGARLVEFYGCTEVAPHCGGYSCPHSSDPGGIPFAHLMEDVGIWELVDPATHERVAPGERGVTVCTSINSESSPQLRFLLADYTTFNYDTCRCGRTHVRAMGSVSGRADDAINLRGVKFFPSQVEEAVRAVPGTGDEFEIVLGRNHDDLPVMTVRIEHPDYANPGIAERVAAEIRSRCEVRATVEALAPETLPKTEFKARRVRQV